MSYKWQILPLDGKYRGSTLWGNWSDDAADDAMVPALLAVTGQS